MQNLPNSWGDAELASLFAQFGAVLECRVLHNGDMTRGAGALVRMSSMQQASAAIDGLNNVQNGTGLPLLVRYVITTAPVLPFCTHTVWQAVVWRSLAKCLCEQVIPVGNLLVSAHALVAQRQTKPKHTSKS